MKGGPALRVCSVSTLVPFDGMAYAGADYYMRHLSALSEFAEVTIVAPRAPVNEASLAKFSGPATVDLADRSRHADGHAFRVAAALYRRWLVVTPGLDYVTSMIDAARRTEPAIVEVHFPNAVGLLTRIRRAMPNARIVAIPYDVHAQGLARVIAHQGSVGRIRALARRAFLRYVERTEARHLNKADLVLVFSEKDCALLRSAGVDRPVVAVQPALTEPRMAAVAERYRPQGNRIAFVGALDREPNADAVRWLLDEILPLIRKQVPDATLTVAGGGAAPELVERCEAAPGVVMTGYVPDLADVYADADIVVAPLRLGAGLKFKVGSAMLWGRPIVASTAAAEGYPPDEGLFGSITDDAGVFAAAVVDLLGDSGRARGIAHRAREWATHQFSTEQLEATLRTHFRG